MASHRDGRSTTRRSGSSTRVPRKFELNPAFAAAHGISENRDESRPPWDNTGPKKPSRVDKSVEMARATGRLSLCNANLKSPLPDSLFNIRSGMQVNYSMDSRESNSVTCFGEESLTLVDLSDNDLSDNDNSEGVPLDERVTRYLALQTFRARRCQLSHIAPNLFQGMECLTVLDLSGNTLNGPFDAFQYLPSSLRELDLSSNAITGLHNGSDHEEIYCPNLISLDVSENQLEELPLDFRLPSLVTLRLGNNRVKSLPEQLLNSSKQRLQTLEAPKNRIKALFDFSSFKELRVLNLCDNEIVDCPKISTSLLRLLLTNNKIVSLEELFPKTKEEDIVFSDLVELHLRSNKLTKLCEHSISPLVKATSIDVGTNNLRDLPFIIGYLPALRNLPIDGNPLRVIRPSLAEDIQALKKSLRRKGFPPEGHTVTTNSGHGYLPSEDSMGAGAIESHRKDQAKADVISSFVGSKSLVLSNRKLTKLPTELLEELKKNAPRDEFDEIMEDGSVPTMGQRIKILDVSTNLLASIDDEWIEALPNLNEYNASKNRLRSLPTNLGSLAITTLSLSKNSLLTQSISQSAICNSQSVLGKSLVHLDISANRLNSIPADLFKLTSIATLNLSYNQIRSLEGWHPGLICLERLDLSNNKISNLGNLPVILGGNSPRLKSLALQNNALTIIPPALGLLDRLDHIDLRGNPQRAVRLSVLDRGCKDILSFLENRLEPKEIEAIRLEQSKYSSGAASDNPSILGPNNGPTSGPTAPVESALVQELEREIESQTIQLNNVHLSEAQKYATKKKLAMTKATLIRERRRIQMESKNKS